MVPALGSSDNYDPDPKFLLTILRNSVFSTTTSPIQLFRSIEDVSFEDPTNRTIRILSRDNVTGAPTMYVLSKNIKLVASEIKTATFTFGSAQEFTKIELPDSDVINIISVVDSDGNDWTEVDYLGQDVILEERDITPNRNLDGFLSSNSTTTESPPPAKLAVFRRKPRRFTTRVNTNLRMELWFGSGDGDSQDEVLLVNSSQIANDKYDQLVNNVSLDPADFLSSDTFGLAPTNTTLTVIYAVGGGVTSNVPSNTITRVENVNILNTSIDYDTGELSLYNQVVSSISINNEQPATGGGDIETVEEIRQNALAFFNAQNRVVTDKDYLVRTLSIPPRLGQIAKAFVIRDEQINNVLDQDPSRLTFNLDDDPYNNRTYVEDPVAPNSVNIYTLGYNSSKNLTTLNSLVKENLSKYLEQFRILTDDVNILDAFVVNIGVNFDIVVYRNYNMNDVLARSIDAVKEFFNIDKWQINQPIILNDLRLTIGSVDGVRTVNNVTISNKYRFKDGRDYQEYRYPINEAIIDDIIYPSLDPCIFEVRYPDTDIVGNARQ
jgi:hypothetical protein